MDAAVVAQECSLPLDRQRSRYSGIRDGVAVCLPEGWHAVVQCNAGPEPPTERHGHGHMTHLATAPRGRPGMRRLMR